MKNRKKTPAQIVALSVGIVGILLIGALVAFILIAVLPRRKQKNEG